PSRPCAGGIAVLTSSILLVCGLLAGTPETIPSGADLAAYDAAKARVGRDAEAQIGLALWCEAHGLQSERIKHLARAVLSDPKNATARGLMGLVAYASQW